MATKTYQNFNPAEKAQMSEWQQALANQQKRQQDLAMLNAASKADTNTMIGFALGKVLSNLYNKWQDNYDERGEYRRTAEAIEKDPNLYINGTLNLSPEEMQKRLSPETLETIRNGLQPNSTVPAQPETQSINISDGMGSGVITSKPDKFDNTLLNFGGSFNGDVEDPLKMLFKAATPYVQYK